MSQENDLIEVLKQSFGNLQKTMDALEAGNRAQLKSGLLLTRMLAWKFRMALAKDYYESGENLKAIEMCEEILLRDKSNIWAQKLKEEIFRKDPGIRATMKARAGKL